MYFGELKRLYFARNSWMKFANAWPSGSTPKNAFSLS